MSACVCGIRDETKRKGLPSDRACQSAPRLSFFFFSLTCHYYCCSPRRAALRPSGPGARRGWRDASKEGSGESGRGSKEQTKKIIEMDGNHSLSTTGRKNTREKNSNAGSARGCGSQSRGAGARLLFFLLLWIPLPCRQSSGSVTRSAEGSRSPRDGRSDAVGVCGDEQSADSLIIIPRAPAASTGSGEAIPASTSDARRWRRQQRQRQLRRRSRRGKRRRRERRRRDAANAAKDDGG